MAQSVLMKSSLPDEFPRWTVVHHWETGAPGASMTSERTPLFVAATTRRYRT